VTTAIGKTGVVGLLRNGDGPTVMLRAERSHRNPCQGILALIPCASTCHRAPRRGRCR
jgi:hippurate hydrolase